MVTASTASTTSWLAEAFKAFNDEVFTSMLDKESSFTSTRESDPDSFCDCTVDTRSKENKQDNTVCYSHDGLVYHKVPMDDYNRAFFSGQLTRQVSKEEWDIYWKLRKEFEVTVKRLRSSDPSGRWPELRQQYDQQQAVVQADRVLQNDLKQNLEAGHVKDIVWCLQETLRRERHRHKFTQEYFHAVMEVVTPDFAEAFCGRLDDGRRHRVSKTHADSIRQLAQLDLGKYPQLFDVQG